MSGDPHPPAGEYDNISFGDAEFQKRRKCAEDNFAYGLMSMDDVELTNETTDPAQDDRAPLMEMRALYRNEIDVLLAQDSGAEVKRQKAIHHIYREAKHPLGSLWDWARRGAQRRGRYRRWRSLQHWAQAKRDASSGDDREKWNANRKTYRTMKRRVYRQIHDNDDDPTGGGLIVTFDGKPCPSWIAAELLKQRNARTWGGVLVSGQRTKEYSQMLCCNMCGACAPGTTCPGMCAGIYTNHACPSTYTCKDGEGAVDLSLYWQFQERNGYLWNNLPRDLVHFSRSGN